MHTERVPRRRDQQGRRRLHRPLRLEILRRADEDLGVVAGGGAGEGRGWWRHGVWWDVKVLKFRE